MSRPYDYDDEPPRRRSSSHVRQYSPDRDPSPANYSGGAGGPYVSGALPQQQQQHQQSAPYYPPPPNASTSSRGSSTLQVPRDDHHRRLRHMPSSPTSSSLSDHRRGRELDHYRGEDGGVWDDDESDDRRSTGRNSNRSRTPLGKAREVVDKTFSQSSSGLGAGVLGAIVGGLVAREASEAAAKHNGHGHGGHGRHDSSNHHELLSTIVGAAVGGLGANALEKRIELSRKKGKEEQVEWERKWGNGNGSHRDRSRVRDGDRERSRDRDGGHRDRDRSRAGRDRDREEGRGGRRHGDRDYLDDEDDYVYDERRYDDRRSPRRY